MRACAIVPALDAAPSVGAVVRSLRELGPLSGAIIVVDDGSADGTGEAAREAGAHVLVHELNRGKGAALRTGMEHALAAGFEVAVTVDADGQHPADAALAVLVADADPAALVLGVRDLLGAGAPRANQISNAISNFFLSFFSGTSLADTQCGLRRYPLRATLALGSRAHGYAFEAEVILRSIAAGTRIVELPVQVVYPPAGMRVTHFDSVRDPARIVGHVLRTVAETRLGAAFGRARSGSAEARSGAHRAGGAAVTAHAKPGRAGEPGRRGRGDERDTPAP